jgi:Kef-type K+ transport system membrane component KefB
MGAVIVDDVLGLIVLSISLGVAGGSVDVLWLAYLLAVSVAFIVLAIYLGTRHFGPLVVKTQARGLKVGLTHAGFMIAMAVAFMMSFLAEAIGLSAVIGAFLAGAMFSRTPLKADFEEGVSFLGALFTPIFFISLGMLVNVWGLTVELLAFGLVLTLVAIVTKLVGCAFPARLLGMSRQESLAVGYGMIPRGEVGLIIAVVALQSGIIGGGLFSIIVLVIVLVSVLPTPLLRGALLRLPKPEAPPEAGAEPEAEL